MLLYCLYCILFINNDALAIHKFNWLFNGKKSISKLENEIPTSGEKFVNDKKYNKMTTLTDKHNPEIKCEFEKEIKSYVNHLIAKAYVRLMSHANKFVKELQYEEDICKIIYNTSSNYSSIFKKYSENLLNDILPINEIDKQLLILDLIEYSNRLLLDECRIILDFMYRESPNTKYKDFNYKFVNLLEALKKNIIEIKKEEMEYVCKKYVICRMVPAYSDYFTAIVEEVLLLPDDKLSYLLRDLKVALSMQSVVITDILSDNIATQLNTELGSIFRKDMVKVRNIITGLREMLTEKHKINRNKDEKLIKKSRSINLLIDIIDKAFDGSDDIILSIYFDNMLAALRRWSKKEELGMHRLLRNFVHFFAESIKSNWDHNAKGEVQVLVEIIMTGNSTNIDYYDYLFTYGSTYLNSRPDYELSGV